MVAADNPVSFRVMQNQLFTDRTFLLSASFVFLLLHLSIHCACVFDVRFFIKYMLNMTAINMSLNYFTGAIGECNSNYKIMK